MNSRLQIGFMPNSKRLHLQDGPIDLIIQAFGPQTEIARAHQAAIARMQTLLDELCAELVPLRQPAPQILHGPTAQRMHKAVLPFCAEAFITPMAAVAGAVADEILSAMLAAANLQRAFVNNGGDIALHLTAGTQLTAGMVSCPAAPCLDGQLLIEAASPTRGIATSGWSGRSFSLGIADAVTITAVNAAAADAAATMIANATNLLDHTAIKRVPACSIDPQSDLGEQLVTITVGPLTLAEKHRAISAGAKLAQQYLAVGRITGAAIHVQNEVALVTQNDYQPELAIA